MTKRVKTLITALVTLLTTCCSVAEQWQLTDKPQIIEFTAFYDGSAITGKFTRFSVDIVTEADQINSIYTIIDIASVDMDTGSLNDEVIKPEWFDSSQFGVSEFYSEQVTYDGNLLIAIGKLTIKGAELVIDLPITWQIDSQTEDLATMTGNTTLDRNAFGIGTPQEKALANAVEVRFSIQLQQFSATPAKQDVTP